MAAVAGNITAAILTASGGAGFSGTMMPPLAKGIGLAVEAWLPTGVVVKCGTVGTAGVGAVTGFLTVPPLPGAAALFASQGMAGPQSVTLINAIVTGISASVSGLPFAGPSASVGVGTALAKVTSANQAALVSILTAYLPASFGSQVETQTQIQFCSALGTVISAQLLLGFGSGAVVGTPTPSSAVGVATCAIVIS